MNECWGESCKKEFVFNGETYVVRALSDGSKCSIQVFKNNQKVKVNKDDYKGDLDEQVKLMDMAESHVRDNINQIY